MAAQGVASEPHHVLVWLTFRPLPLHLGHRRSDSGDLVPKKACWETLFDTNASTSSTDLGHGGGGARTELGARRGVGG